MTSLNVATQGLSYLRECLALYSENCAFFVLYVAALVFVCIKGNDREKRIFLPGAVMLLLTVYNPVFPVIINSFFDVNSEYYRFFWIAPVLVLVPYMAVKLIMLQEKNSGKIVLGIVIAVIFILSGNFLYANGYKKAENVYKMPEELIEISELIHEDATVEYPKAFLEYEYNMQMRQYDPKMLLTVDREDYLYATSNDYTSDMLNDENFPQYKLLAALIKYQFVEQQAVLDALELTHTEYVVLDKNNKMGSFLKDAGLAEIAETDNHIIYKYTLKEPYVFELVDYTPVY